MGIHAHSWKWAEAMPPGQTTPYEFCLGCGLRRTKYPVPRRAASSHVHVGRWCSECLVIAHDLRTYARHESGCAFQGASGPRCDCGFDELLERYDRVAAE